MTAVKWDMADIEKRLEAVTVSGLSIQQIRGIEPPSPAWEAGILPMNYICICMFLL